jgi:hypothetical protein
LKRALKEITASTTSEFRLTTGIGGQIIKNATLEDLKVWLKREKDEPYGIWTIERWVEGIGNVEAVGLFERMLNWGTSDDGKNMQVYLSPRENSMIEIENILMKFIGGDESWRTDLEWKKAGVQPILDEENLEILEDDELEDEELS